MTDSHRSLSLPFLPKGRLILIAALLALSSSIVQAYTSIVYDAIVSDKSYTDDGMSNSALILNSNYYYEGTNIKVSSGYNGGNALYANSSNYVTIDGGSLNKNGTNGNGIYFYYVQGRSKTSSITNYTVIHENGGSGITMVGTELHLGDVAINITLGAGTNAYGLSAKAGSTISNPDGKPVTINTDGNGAALHSTGSSSINLSNTAITSANNNSGTYGAIYAEGDNTSVSLTNSSIEHHGSAPLISGHNTEAGAVSHVTLNNVDLSKSTNQDIRLNADSTGTTNVSITAGTGITGQVSTNGSDGNINLSLANTSWTVTQDSSLTDLWLDSQSSLTFQANGVNDFMDITAASVMLQAGALLKIDVTDIEPLIDQQFQLFKGDLDTYELNNAAMVSADGRLLIEYEEGSNGKGWFVIKGYQVIEEVPEPSTAGLAALPLTLLLFRRRRSR